MYRACCLVNVAPEQTLLLTTALGQAIPGAKTTIALLDVPVLNTLAPGVLVIDVDGLAIDPLEAVRRIRFVLPDSAVVVYTGSPDAAFARACHNAGATCLLSKNSSIKELATGIRHAIRSGCYTDPRFRKSA